MAEKVSGAGGQGRWPSLSWFKDEKNTTEALLRATVLGVLTREELLGASQAAPSQRTAELTRQAEARSKEAVHQALTRFRRVKKELTKLSSHVETKLGDLHGEVRQDKEQAQMEMAEVEDRFEDLNSTVGQLEVSISQMSRTAAHIGERLYNSEIRRQIAMEAIDIIDFMQHFSVCSEDFGTLPDLFHNKDMLAESAGTATKLLAVADELTTAKHRVDGQGAAGDVAASTAACGSLEFAVRRLQQYCNLLENRVVGRFDHAVKSKSIPILQECARIMAEFNREPILIQRYISQMPMFMDARLLSWGEDSGQGKDLVVELGQLYKEIHATVKDEVLVLESVFPSPVLAVESLIQRVVEQRVGLAIEATLNSVATRAYSTEVARAEDRLKMLTQIYTKTLDLAVSLEGVCNKDISVQDQVQSLLAEHLANYPDSELRLLKLKFEGNKIDSRSLSVATMDELTEWHKQALQRCVQLSTELRRPQHVRLLFSATDEASARTSGSMLDQVSRYLSFGLQQAAERSSQGCADSVLRGSVVFQTNDRSVVAAAATKALQSGLGEMLHAMQTAAQVIARLQVHYRDSVLPLVTNTRTEELKCSSGLAGLLKSSQVMVLRGATASLSAFFTQVDSVLVGTQKGAEFLPAEGSTMVETPTPACILCKAMLQAAVRMASDTLTGANLLSMQSELARRTHMLLVNHLQRFTFSQTGALRLKRDVSEYMETVQAMGVPALQETLDTELKAIVSILIISPSSLLGVVDGSLRMSHREALRYVQMREDFKTARVGNKSLAVLFSSE